ncbi:MAG TPA: hypothetical protein VEI24_05175 [Nitrospiria bacterium]|nr:hypothetical protein [Nitrospiria bacterium]
MTLDIDKVEAILRKHWQIPSELSRARLQEHAGRIHVLVRQKYSRENLKYQLGLIQTTKLHQDLDDQACNQIAAELLKLAS